MTVYQHHYTGTSGIFIDKASETELQRVIWHPDSVAPIFPPLPFSLRPLLRPITLHAAAPLTSGPCSPMHVVVQVASQHFLPLSSRSCRSICCSSLYGRAGQGAPYPSSCCSMRGPCPQTLPGVASRSSAPSSLVIPSRGPARLPSSTRCSCRTLAR